MWQETGLDYCFDMPNICPQILMCHMELLVIILAGYTIKQRKPFKTTVTFGGHCFPKRYFDTKESRDDIVSGLETLTL